MITLNINEISKVSGGDRCRFNIGGGELGSTDRWYRLKACPGHSWKVDISSGSDVNVDLYCDGNYNTDLIPGDVRSCSAGYSLWLNVPKGRKNAYGYVEASPNDGRCACP